MQIESTHYQVWVEGDTYWTVYFHVRRGHGRAARRRLTGTYHLDKSPELEGSPALLRALAAAVEERSRTQERA